MPEIVCAEIPERKGISGAFVNVRLGVALGVVALLIDAGLLAIIVAGTHLWLGAALASVAAVLSGYAAYLGIYGVIRYGLFTEGYGTAEVEGELQRSRVARWAGILAQVALLATIVLIVVLIVVALL